MPYRDKEKKKAYNKDYCEANKEKLKAYYEVNKEKIKATKKAWFEANKEKIKAYREVNKEKSKATKKAWDEANKEKVKAYNEDNKEKRKAYYEVNKEKMKVYRSLYQKNNKGIINAISSKRRANKIMATPSWANLEKIKEIYKNCPEGYHVDHIYPLKSEYVCGLHVENNLQYLTAKENMEKSNKIIDKYL